MDSSDCYYHDTTEAKLMLDFGLEKGDVVYAGNTCVTDVDYITVNGIKRKRITIDDHQFGYLSKNTLHNQQYHLSKLCRLNLYQQSLTVKK